MCKDCTMLRLELASFNRFARQFAPVYAKSIPEPMLTHYILDHRETTSIKFESKYLFIQENGLKYCLQNNDHYAYTSMC